MSTNRSTKLKEVLDRLERLDDEIATLKDDAKVVMEEVKNNEESWGFSVKEVRAAHALQRKGARKTKTALDEAFNTLVEAGVIDPEQILA